MNPIFSDISKEEQYIIQNLAKATLYHTRKVKKYSFIKIRWRIDENKLDDVSDFFMEKNLLIIQTISNGFKVGSFDADFCSVTNRLINSFIFWMINRYKSKEESQERFETKMRSSDEESIKPKITKWESEMKFYGDILVANDRFLSTLTTTEDKIIWSYIIFGGEDKKRREYAEVCWNAIGIGRTQFFERVKKMKSRAQTEIGEE